MRRVTVVIGLVVGAACSSGGASSRAETPLSTAGVADSVRAATSDLLAAIRARDSARVLGYFATDSAMRLIEGVVMTRDELAGMAGTFYRTMASIDATIEAPLHVAILGPDAAVASGRYHDVFVDTAGKRIEARGIGTWVWTRRAGRWQILHQHATPDAPAGVQ